MEVGDKATIIDGEYKGQYCYIEEFLKDDDVKVTPLWGYWIVKKEHLKSGWIKIV